MNKIIAAALSAIYPNVKIDNLVEVINATPNPIMATDMLLGVYESPKVSHVVTDGQHEYRLLSVDEWRSQISYSYFVEEKKGFYFPQGTQKEDLTLENYKEFQRDGNTDVYYLLSTGEYREKTGIMPIEQWTKMTPVIVQYDEDIFGE